MPGEIMKVEQHSVVSIHYVLTDEQKTVLDSSEGQDPLTYLHGTGGLIPGLEKEILGKAVGDKFDVTVDPVEGYGELDESLVQKVPLEVFEGVDKVEPGMQFRTEDQDGSSQLITVTDVEDEEVTIDMNHPLAGVTLYFDIEITAIRDATEEEIEHGHTH
jgi:FKBP-type peptidyl-prolyl cis-trans isomerase SlyD